MLSLSLSNSEPLRLLCLGAHCDDIEIGCGGTILGLVARARKIEVHWVVFSSDGQRKQEALKSAEAFLCGIATKKIVIHALRDGFFPYAGAELKERFEQLKADISPDLILTHYRHDLHQDHRLISELTWNTFRNHLILEYEIPKFDGDFGSPNVFVPLDESICRRKIDTILDAFQSQTEKHWFSRDLFSAVLRLRGMEANACSGYAEGFYCRKANINLALAWMRIYHRDPARQPKGKRQFSPRRHEGHEGFRRVRFAHRSVSEYFAQRRQGRQERLI